MFRKGVGSLLDGFTICSPVRDETGEIIDFRWEYANDAACAHNGLTRGQMLGHRISEVLPGYTSTNVFKLHRRVAQTGEPVRVDEVSWQGEWVAGRQVDRAYDGSVVPLGPNIIVTGRDVTEARRNERKLRLQGELLELAHDAVIVRDPAENRVTFWNREAQAIYGYSPEEALGRITHELLATVFPESREAVDDAMAREGQWAGDLRHTRKDGRIIVVSSRQALQRAANGQPLAIIELNSDVTERKRVEEALRASERLFHSGFDDSPTGMALTSLDGTLVEVNAAFAGMLGFDDPAQLAGQDFARFTHPDDVAANREGIRMMVDEGKPYVAEKRYIRRDRAVVYALMGSTAVLDADGRPSMLFTQVQDITERKLAEAALRASEERFRGGFENSPIGMALVDPSGRYLEVNSTHARMLGVEDPGEMIGLSFESFVHPDDVADTYASIERLHETGTDHGERRYIRKDGATVYALFGSSVVRDADGQPSVLFSQAEDITERKRVEEALRASEQRFRGGFENSPIGMALVGLDGRLPRGQRHARADARFCRPGRAGRTELHDLHPSRRGRPRASGPAASHRDRG